MNESPRRWTTPLILMAWIASLLSAATLPTAFSQEAPRSLDPDLEVTLFAREPLVATPTGIAIDSKGRIFVALNQTHFRPDDYDGPERDQIVVLFDDDRDGKADRKHVFYQGFENLMDLAFHPDGTIYAATRAAIYRLPDRDGDLRADRAEPIVRLETEATYPHNGLSGLAFDFRGDLQFGIGENLGKSYRLIGSDGTTISRDEGTGGTSYFCRADGTGLRLVSIGWWNPYGLCVDSFERAFGTDNDPDSSPPCRLHYIVPGADYGYEFRYGRSGLNPLITWTGLMPGTLPMASPTGEAPAGIIAYEGSAFPRKYFGSLLVPIWSDHRVERYEIASNPRSGMPDVERSVLIEGTGDFRPVDIAVAPDGSVYFTDWVLARYAIHGLGRVWRIAPRDRQRVATTPSGVTALERASREEAAREAIADSDGWQRLARVLHSDAPGAVRATSLAALNEIRTRKDSRMQQIAGWMNEIVRDDRSLPFRLMAARLLGADWHPRSIQELPIPLRCIALQGRLSSLTPEDIRAGLESDDAAYRFAAITALAADHLWNRMNESLFASHGASVLLAARQRNVTGEARLQWIGRGLASDDPSTRLMAIKWLADDRVSAAGTWLEDVLKRDDLSWHEFRSVSVAQQRLGRQKVTDWPSKQWLLGLLKSSDDRLSPTARRWIVRAATYRRVGLDLKWLAKQARSAAWHDEAAWALVYHPSRKRFERLRGLAKDRSAPVTARSIAVVGLAQLEGDVQPLLIELARSDDPALAEEALRGLVGMKLDAQQRSQLKRIAVAHRERSHDVERAVTGKLPPKPAVTDTAAWLGLIKGFKGDASRGERVFFHPKITACGKCHEVRGRGTRVGPSLSMIHARLRVLGDDGRRWLLETILQPSREMAPQYTPWLIQTSDGKTWTGLPLRKGGSAEAYLDQEGKEFRLKKETIDAHRESSVSIMPEGLLTGLTPREIADLMAFLMGG